MHKATEDYLREETEKKADSWGDGAGEPAERFLQGTTPPLLPEKVSGEICQGALLIFIYFSKRVSCWFTSLAYLAQLFISNNWAICLHKLNVCL